MAVKLLPPATSISELDPGRLYKIQEHTKGEWASVKPGGDVARWTDSGYGDQWWAIIPDKDGKIKLLNQEYKEYMSVHTQNGNVLRWVELTEDSGKANEQIFLLEWVESEGKFYIHEFTNDELVISRDKGIDSEFHRWDSGAKAQEKGFTFHPIKKQDKPIAEAPQYEPALIPTPKNTPYAEPPGTETDRYLVGQIIIPAPYINDGKYRTDWSDVAAQIEQNPYYIWSRYQYWSNAEETGYLYQNEDPHNSWETTYTIKTGFSQTEADSITKSVGVTITNQATWSFGGSFSFEGIGAESNMSTSWQREVCNQLTVTSSSSTTTWQEEMQQFPVTVTAHSYEVGWCLVNHYTVTRMDGSLVKEWYEKDKTRFVVTVSQD